MSHKSTSRLRRALPAGASLLIGTLCAPAHAAAPTGAGQLLDTVPRTTAPAPAAGTPLRVDSADGITAASGPAFLVQHVEVTGAALLPEARVRELVAPAEGRELTLAELRGVAGQLTAAYRAAGYPFVQVYVPPQTIEAGRVRIAVLEARYDRVELRNTSPVRDAVLAVPLRALEGGPVEAAPLDRALLLLSDLPGTSVVGTLHPGRTPGASELLVEVARVRQSSSSASVDSFGETSTGRVRASGTLSLANPLHSGDQVTLAALTAGRGLNYGALGYALPLHGPATQLDLQASALAYRLVSDATRPLDADGDATVLGAGVTRVLLRSTSTRAIARLGYETSRLHDRVGVAQSRNDRHTDALRLSVSGEHADAYGRTSASLVVSHGRLHFDDAIAAAVDAAGADAAGSFTRYVVDVSRVQPITERDVLVGQLRMQRASRNLDSSEQFYAGGAGSLRGHASAAAAGTQGWAATAEWRRGFALPTPGAWQASLFVDGAHAQPFREPFGERAGGYTLASAGTGLVWSLRGLVASAQAAVPVGPPPPGESRHGLRVWAQVQQTF